MTTTVERLRTTLAALSLTAIDARLETLLESASKKEPSYGDFLLEVVSAEWGSIFGDPIIATAILDGLLHHSTTVNIRGESYRLKERRKAGLIPLPEQHPAEPSAAAQNARGKRNHSL